MPLNPIPKRWSEIFYLPYTKYVNNINISITVFVEGQIISIINFDS